MERDWGHQGDWVEGPLSAGLGIESPRSDNLGC